MVLIKPFIKTTVLVCVFVFYAFFERILFAVAILLMTCRWSECVTVRAPYTTHSTIQGIKSSTSKENIFNIKLQSHKDIKVAKPLFVAVTGHDITPGLALLYNIISHGENTMRHYVLTLSAQISEYLRKDTALLQCSTTPGEML